MNIYKECVDFGFVMVKDRINDMLCAGIAGAPHPSGSGLSAVLACQDKYLRVYAGERLYHEFSVEGPGTALTSYGPEKAEESLSVLMVYGTEQGTIGICTVDSKSMQRTVGITDRQQRMGVSGNGAGARRARVSALHTADVTKSGAHDILVGRDDGNFEVWSLGGNASFAAAGSARNEQVPPQLVFEKCLAESIQSMDSGNIAGGEHDEIVLTTYGGKVLGFSSDSAARDPTGVDIAQVEDKPVSMLDMATGQNPNYAKKRVLTAKEETEVKGEKDKRFLELQREVEKLKQELDGSKAQYQKLSSSEIAVNTTTKVTHRFNLNNEEACHVLTIESQSPLELVSLCAGVEVDLLDSDGTSAILSQTKGDSSMPLRAAYRMQESGSRFQIKMRVVEGLSGQIACFVTPASCPKTAHMVTLALKPLSLHEKISEAPLDVPMNEVRLTGSFTVMDMHRWLGLCVNELPSRPTDDEMIVAYRSTFVGSVLHGKYGKGYATFRSDSVTTIGVLKDLITKEATNMKINLSINVDVREETFPRFLELINPKLTFQHSLAQQVRMVEPLREMQLQEGQTKFLSPELQQVLDRATEIQQQHEEAPRRLAFLHNIVVAAYKDKWRLKGHMSVEHRLKDLVALLQNYDAERITSFFADPLD